MNQLQRVLSISLLLDFQIVLNKFDRQHLSQPHGHVPAKSLLCDPKQSIMELRTPIKVENGKGNRNYKKWKTEINYTAS